MQSKQTVPESDKDHIAAKVGRKLKSSTIKALYEQAQALEGRWSNVRLQGDFVGRAIFAVLRQAERKSRMEGTESFSLPALQRTLAFVFKINARRDAARIKRKNESTFSEMLADVPDPTDPFAEVHDRAFLAALYAGLVAEGFPAPIVFGFLCRALDAMPLEISMGIKRTLKVDLHPRVVENWRFRQYPKIRKVARLLVKSLREGS